ncbi:MAG TPA: hypothetical protein VFQ53_33365 [Kofleriaceae bacterium]|nr:hypothetical protein [Kofleriaceae bacterium]
MKLIIPRSSPPLVFSVLAASLVTACVDADSEDPGAVDDPDATGEVTQAACTVTGTNISRSLAVTSPEVLAKFSFARTMSAIRTTAAVGTVQTNKSIFQTWFKTFGATTASGDCNDPNIDPNDYGLQCPRTPELKLASIDPFSSTSGVSFKPIGLFNRFDLAPSNGANCGEYRIVYAMQSTNPNISGRGFIIFEAALPNPRTDLGKAGCLPVARFWQNLTSDADVLSRAAKLERFYYTGGAVTGFPAVVRAAHYGLANGSTAAFKAGQIRTNFFVDFVEWHLREYKLRRTCTDPTDATTCRLRVDHVTVKNNPAEELFAGTHAKSATFRTSFLNSVGSLARASVNTLGMSTGNDFNEFESVSQRLDVNYATTANTDMRSAITAKLSALGSTLTATNILDRATTQTCAGCHQVSNNASLGGGLVWPSSLVFVQIDETSALSPALTTKFLPHRKAVLERFINNSCSTTPARVADDLAGDAVDDELTIGGSPVGAAN